MSGELRKCVLALPAAGYMDWGGGVDLLRIILNGLASRRDKYDVRLLVPPATPGTIGPGLLGVARQLKALVRRGKRRMLWAWSYEQMRQLAAEYYTFVRLEPCGAGRRGLAETVASIKAQVVFPSLSPLGTGFVCPWVAYIVDFQHRHYPDFFSWRERIGRDIHLRAMMSQAALAVTNSEAVVMDAQRFYHDLAKKLTPLPFSASARPSWFDVNTEEVQRKYALDAPYFIVCNQFWAHKDHATAIRAFARLLRETVDRNILLVCTGKQDDYRAPGYIDQLNALCAQLGISAQVRMLGFLPKTEQIALLRGAVALLQPTLFEGGPGGGAVYDAVALGVPCAVSDIRVNREIACRRCAFFKPGDDRQLSELMRSFYVSPPARPDRAQLDQESRTRIEALGETIDSIIERAISNDSGPRASRGKT